MPKISSCTKSSRPICLRVALIDSARSSFESIKVPSRSKIRARTAEKRFSAPGIPATPHRRFREKPQRFYVERKELSLCGHTTRDGVMSGRLQLDGARCYNSLFPRRSFRFESNHG